MARPQQQELPLDAKLDIEDMPLATLDDFRKYNSAARKHNREKGKLIYRMKIPHSDLHKQIKIKFQRFDQPENILKACCSNSDIDWKGQLKSGQTYTLPAPVVKFLNSLATPIYEEVPTGKGKETETKQTGERARFSCQVLDFDE